MFQKCSEFAERLNHYSLKNEIANQSKSFVDRFHKAKSAHLISVLEDEKWTVCEVSKDIQEMVNELCCTKKKEEQQERQMHLCIKNKQFKVVNSCLIVIHLVSEYLKCSRAIPFVSSEVFTDLLRLLKSYNSKCALLILGAQGMW